MRTFKNIKEIIKLNKENNFYFFNKNTKEIWKSKINPNLIHGTFFITTEVNTNDSIKATIRMTTEHGDIEKIGLFQQYETIEIAKFHAKHLPPKLQYALKIAKESWLKQDMKFFVQAMIQPLNTKYNKYDKNNFTGACSYLLHYAYKLDKQNLMCRNNEIITFEKALNFYNKQ